MIRLLLDPAADAGGAATEAVAEKVAEKTTEKTAQTQAESARIHLSPEEYRRLLDTQSRLAALEDEKRRELEAKENERLKALAAKGDAEEALKQLREAKDNEIKTARERAAQVEAERLADRKEAALASSLMGTDWISDDAAAQVRMILDGRFEAVRDDAGRVAVVEKGTRRPASDVIKEWLASPASAHFRKPSTTGGAGATGGDRTTKTPAAGDQPQFKTLGEMLLHQAQQARGTAAAGDNKPAVRIHGGLGFGF